MVTTQLLVQYCDQELAIACKDGCPNGLQVEGCEQTTVLITGVTASMELLHQAHARGAQTILVHHGYFWRSQPRVITGWMQRRLKFLLQHNINLIAYHLPLDYHRIWGNNVQLAKHLGWQIDSPMHSHAGITIGMLGHLDKATPLHTFVDIIARKLSHSPIVIQGHSRPIKNIAWCTGAAGDDIEYAAQAGVDAYITGEISENIVHVAKETAMVVIAAGHHATERYGVQALGHHLAEKFDLKHEYVEVNSPI